MGTLFARFTRGTALGHIRHLTPVAPRSAPDRVAQVYRQVERDFGMLAPPVALHAPAPEALAACWLLLRETLLAAGAATRAEKESVAVAVSRANSCPYCVQVHHAALTGLLRPQPGGRRSTSSAPTTLGAGTGTGTGTGTGAGVSAELTGVAVTFHYLNRMVNIFLADSPLPPVRGPARRVAGWVAEQTMGVLARPALPPGGALALLPAAPLPRDLGWAAGRANVAAAMARAAAAVDAAGVRSVPPRVQRLVLSRLDRAGPPQGAGLLDWLEPALAALPVTERPAGRLALLTAFASYRVTDRVVDDFRRACPGDDTLVELTCWAAFTAARRTARQSAGQPAGQPTGTAPHPHR